MPLTTTEANNLLNGSVRTSNYTAPTLPIKMALATTAPTASAAGTEVTGGSYARQDVTFGTAASAASIANTAVVTYAGMPTASVSHVDVYDSAGSPVRKWFGAITGGAKSVTAGDTLSFAIGAITLSLGTS